MYNSSIHKELLEIYKILDELKLRIFKLDFYKNDNRNE